MHVCATSTIKGGVGKTTITREIAAIIGQQLHGLFADEDGQAPPDAPRVLLIDYDPQCNLSTSVGVEPSHCSATLTDYYLQNDQVRLADVVTTTGWAGVDLLPCSEQFNEVDAWMVAHHGADRWLATDLQLLSEQYEYVFIDCGPAKNLLVTSALMASDWVISVHDSSTDSIKGAIEAAERLAELHRGGCSARFAGAAWNRYRLNDDSNATFDALRQATDFPWFHTKTRELKPVRRAREDLISVIEQDPRSPSASELVALTNEILDVLNTGTLPAPLSSAVDVRGKNTVML